MLSVRATVTAEMSGTFIRASWGWACLVSPHQIPLKQVLPLSLLGRWEAEAVLCEASWKRRTWFGCRSPSQTSPGSFPGLDGEPPPWAGQWRVLDVTRTHSRQHSLPRTRAATFSNFHPPMMLKGGPGQMWQLKTGR